MFDMGLARIHMRGYTKGLRIPFHQHTHGVLTIAISGLYEESLGGQTHVRRAPLLHWLPPGHSHAERHLRWGCRILIEIDPRHPLAVRLVDPAVLATGSALLFVQRLRQCLLIGDPDDVRELIAEMIDVIERWTPAAPGGVPKCIKHARDLLHLYALQPAALTLASRGAGITSAELGRGFYRAFATTPGAYLRQLRHRHYAHCAPPPELDIAKTLTRQRLLSVKTAGDVGRLAGVSYAHLAKLFRMHEDISVHGWLTKQRVEYGRVQLTTTQASINHVAAMLGYRDPRSFERNFAHVYGTSARVYRDEHGLDARRDRMVAQWYDEDLSSLRIALQRAVGDCPDVDDVLQDAVIQAWRSIARFDPARGSLRGWLLSIAKSRAIDAHRRRARERKLLGAALEQAVAIDRLNDPEVAVVSTTTTHIVDVAIRRLDVSARTPVRAFLQEQRTQREVADMLGRPLGTVKTQLRRGLGQLRAELRSVFVR